ncbi:retinol dehydrogenase 12-like [Colias croceus]|uniref:retinol dehydrogenase 12-like n=1 Tax=Colias crocea TaxID=72248 RepID=UPI001E27AD19|nr:retinol dehydrogenase 12-like [Colias croceus]
MDYLSGWCKSKRRLDGYTVIITGCNTGIGKETTLDLYKRGAKIIMACRNTDKAEEAKADIIKKCESETETGSLVIEKLDLSSLNSVRECAFRILAKEDKINILINNAGIMMIPKGRTEDGFETQIGTNHFGHAMFTFLLLPRIIKSAPRPARIVNVASLAHFVSNVNVNDINLDQTWYGSVKAYGRSKSANILFARAIHLKLRERNINDVNTYSLHPGVVRTELGRNFFRGLIFGATWVFNNIISVFIKSPQCGAQTTIYCAIDEECANESGLYYSDCSKARRSSQCRNDSEALKLWDMTIEKLNLQKYDPLGDVDPTEDIFIQKV